MNPKKGIYLVVGGGATGFVLINCLAKQPEVNQIYCITKDSEKTKDSLSRNAKIKVSEADIKTLEKKDLLSKVSTIINAASPWFNERILKLALKWSLNYMDLEALLGIDDGKSKSPYKIEHLKYDKLFKKNKLVALFDAGAAPGLTNLMVAEAAEKMGGLDSVELAMLEELKGKGFISAWSPAALVDELLSRPVVYERGKFHLLRPFSNPKLFKFPRPFGSQITYPIMNNEAFTIPHYLKLKKIEVRSGGEDNQSSKLLYNMGILSNKPVNVKGRKVIPSDLLTAIMPPPPSGTELKRMMEVKIIQDGYFILALKASYKNKAINGSVSFPSQAVLYKRGIYSTYIGYAAGVCAAVFAIELPRLTKFGTYPPENIESSHRTNIFEKLKKMKIKVKLNKE